MESHDPRKGVGPSEQTPNLLQRLEDEHGPDCPYGCPVCLGISIVRQMGPEVTSHLAAAAREFVLAAKAFLDGIAEQRAPVDSEPRVRRIPLD